MRRSGVSTELPPTEAIGVRSAGLDLLSTPRLVELLIAEQREAVEAAMARTGIISEAVDEIAARLERGGVLHYVGAGTSGRLAMLDAAEMPPTFGTSPELVRAHVAGGTPALTRSIEGAEDDAAAGDAAIRESVSLNDAVVGISASGGAAFVVAAIECARSLGAYTVALTGSEHSMLARAANLAIVLATGPEVLSGSTRMKAGTAQKIVLNAISTAVMVRIGRVYDNLMVDLVASNAKLRARAVRIVRAIAEVDEPRALELLAATGGHVKLAIVMARQGVDAARARALLERTNGSLRALL
jgi:N-acetylmuramic acid 6-phosphate etherase